jgi:hypothetical protein
MLGQLRKTLILLISAVLPFSQTSTAQTGQCATVIQGNPLPDLIVNSQRLKLDMLVTQEKFAATDCAVVEGCVSGKGNHQLLRFTSATPNIGGGDLFIGDPLQCPNLFVQSQCHNHLHFKQYADYRVWTEAGYNNWVANRVLSEPTNTGTNATLLAQAIQNGDLIVGRKQGFCIIDTDKYDPNAPNTKKYTLCGTNTTAGNQGLQVGWEDSYGQQLDCQYVQIDKLPAGVYVLEVQTNAEQLLPESDYTNNSTAVKFQFIPKHGNTPAQTIVLE